MSGPELTADSQHLLESIRAASAASGPNLGVTWDEAEELDNCGTKEEIAIARARDADRHWSQVPDAAIESFPSAPRFLDAAGFRYCLPAAMKWSIRFGHTSDSSTADNLLTLLGESDRQGWLRRLLDEKQLQVTGCFVLPVEVLLDR